MGRSPCCDKNGLKRGPWTPEEDQKLIDYINKHGYGNWRTLPANAGLQRCGKSCRLRWTNYLRPDIKRGRFSFEEEQTIIQLHSILGNKWSAIASRLPGRTDNEIKNYWNTHIRKKLLRMGIDPVTHTPRLDLFDLSSILPFPNMVTNPHFLRLAASLLSNNIKSEENVSSSQIPYNMQDNGPQMPPLVQDFPNCSQLLQQQQQEQQLPNVDFGLENNWQGNNIGVTNNSSQDYLSMQNYGYYEPVEPQPVVMDPLLNSNSNSTQVNSCSTTTTEDNERDISYCSDNLFNFDVTNIFDVNEFM